MSEYENKQFEDTGFETPTTNAIVSEKSKVVAAVLAFFLGGFGIHRFYVGKIGSGLVMLVLWFIGLFTFFLYIKKLDSSVEKTKNAVLNSICF